MICGKTKESESEFCARHLAAKSNLDLTYEKWRSAFGGNISKEAYFKRLLELQETGNAVKLLIKRLLLNLAVG